MHKGENLKATAPYFVCHELNEKKVISAQQLFYITLKNNSLLDVVIAAPAGGIILDVLVCDWGIPDPAEEDRPPFRAEIADAGCAILQAKLD